MKKIVFGILSLLLITPVFADSIYPNWITNSAISFESLTENSNLTYLITSPNACNNCGGFPAIMRYIQSNGSVTELYGIKTSSNQSDFGSSINDSNLSLIYQFSDPLSSSNTQFNGYPLLSFNLSGGLPLLTNTALYLQSSQSGKGNYLIALSSSSPSVDNTYSLSSPSYIRYFYNTGLGFTGIVPTYSDFTKNPVGVQIFSSNSLYTLTNKAQVYDFAGQNSLNKNWVLSSFFDGYSYILLSGDDISFHSVLPFSQFISSDSYNIPDYLETSDFLLFRGDGNNYLGSNNSLGVIKYIDGELYYSKYFCDGVTYTEINGSYLINLDSACSLIDGGIVSNTGGWSSCGWSYLNNIFKKVADSSDCGNAYYGNFLSLSFSNNSLVVDSLKFGKAGYNNSFSFGLTSQVGVDLLSGFVNTVVPDIPDEDLEENYGKVVNTICKLSPYNPICKDGQFFQDSGTDVSFSPDGSGNILVTVTLYDTEDENCPDIYYTGSNGQLFHQYFDRICYTESVFVSSDSSPEFGLDDFSDTGQYTQLISGAFVGILSGFNIHQCPFRSPFGVLRLGTIGGMGSFLLDKFFDVNIIGPFSCLLGGVLYSTSDSQSISNQLVHYDGQKFLNSWSDQSKQYLNYLLMALIVILFRRFRPNSNSDH